MTNTRTLQTGDMDSEGPDKAESTDRADRAREDEDSSMEVNVSYIVKTHIFPMLKFLQGPSSLAFSTNPNTPCGTYFGRSQLPCVDDPETRNHWQQTARVIPSILNAKRTSVTK